MVSGPGSTSLMFICRKCLAVVQKSLGVLLKHAFNIAKEVISSTLTLEWFLCLKLTIPLLQKKKKHSPLSTMGQWLYILMKTDKSMVNIVVKTTHNWDVKTVNDLQKKPSKTKQTNCTNHTTKSCAKFLLHTINQQLEKWNLSSTSFLFFPVSWHLLYAEMNTYLVPWRVYLWDLKV